MAPRLRVEVRVVGDGGDASDDVCEVRWFCGDGLGGSGSAGGGVERWLEVSSLGAEDVAVLAEHPEHEPEQHGRENALRRVEKGGVLVRLALRRRLCRRGRDVPAEQILL